MIAAWRSYPVVYSCCARRRLRKTPPLAFIGITSPRIGSRTEGTFGMRIDSPAKHERLWWWTFMRALGRSCRSPRKSSSCPPRGSQRFCDLSPRSDRPTGLAIRAKFPSRTVVMSELRSYGLRSMRSYHNLAKGERVKIDTSSGHRWLVRAGSEKNLAVFEAREGDCVALMSLFQKVK
jgi:hypothetical protein